MGDRNTTFFHYHALTRNRCNKISQLYREDGSKTTDKKGMRDLATSYFQTLFDGGVTGDFDYILSGVEASLSDLDNQQLTAPYFEEEIVQALKGMGSTKASRFDGFLALFFSTVLAYRWN